MVLIVIKLFSFLIDFGTLWNSREFDDYQFQFDKY
jgi:hypothetical protein